MYCRKMAEANGSTNGDMDDEELPPDLYAELGDLILDNPNPVGINYMQVFGGADALGFNPGAEELRDIDDCDGAVCSADLGNGPITAMRTPFQNMPGWRQRILVSHVDPFDVRTTLEDGTSDMTRVEVIVEYQGPEALEPLEITRLTWIQPR